MCGSFDEYLVQTFVEPDYSFRASKIGLKTYFVRDAKTVHNIAVEDMLTSKSLGGKFSQKAYYLMRNRTILVKRYGTPLQRIIYLTIFSWVWPTVYSLLILREKRFDLIKLYWRGWLDGIRVR
jgi:GT2 family glycosyltransferase